jgi:hypothetical protein
VHNNIQRYDAACPAKNGSITHGRQYHSMIYAYYVTRFPERTIHFVNAGISGDSAGGARGRLEDDVISKSPLTV